MGSSGTGLLSKEGVTETGMRFARTVFLPEGYPSSVSQVRKAVSAASEFVVGVSPWNQARSAVAAETAFRSV